MDTFLEGEVAIVTGGTWGIDRAIAEAPVGCGVSVAICGRVSAEKTPCSSARISL